jgi:uncharacterized membrane protein
MKSFSLIIGTLFLLQACNFYNSKTNEDLKSLTTNSVSWSRVSSEVFQARCLECHSQASGNAGGVNLETYQNAVGNLDQIREQALVLKAMPPGGESLTSYQQTLLADWISAGAPLDGIATTETPPVPEPTIVPEPTTAPVGSLSHFSLIREAILLPQCSACHGPGGSVASIAILDYDFLLNPANGYVFPGHPETSGLLNALTRMDGLRMPLGGPPLSSDQIQTIEEWIQNGALND